MSSRAFAALTLLSRFLLPPAIWASSPWFSFAPAGIVTTGSAVDASGLLVDHPGQDIATLIDSRGHLQSRADGHFYFENTGRRARFFGINFLANTIFPPFVDAPQQPGEYMGFVPADAVDQLATRLAQLGINVVRLHFLDGLYPRPVSIWDANFPDDTLHFDPLQIRRLDYLIYRLKAHGIYCDLNLHVGRMFRSGDGVADYDLFPALSYDKPATQFDSVMITRQQEYAADLLNHTNPYTGLRLADDPALAFVELSNEDSMMYSFANNQLSTFTSSSECLQGMSCGLPPSYSLQLDQRWNAWLLNKYGSPAALQAAWVPALVINEVRNATFSIGMDGWTLRCFNGAQGGVTYDTSSTESAARIDVAQVSGQLWGLQLDQSGLSLQNGQLYDLTIKFKGTSNEQLGVDLIQDQSPFSFYQTVGNYTATSDWQTIQTTFRAAVTNSGHVQINLNVGLTPGSVWISEVRLMPHAVSGVTPTEFLESQSVLRQTTASLPGYTVARNQDLAQFYYDLEQSFFDGMRSYLQINLGVKSMITGSAVLGLPLNADLASRQDFVDEHYYFDYPILTDADSSVSSWTIENKAFTSDPLFWLFNIASLAVQGKPFTVSETGEPFPNDHQSEWLSWLTTFANFQDWDAIMPNSFVGWPDSYFSPLPPGWPGNFFFGLSDNVIATAQFPVAARIFLTQQNSPAAQQMLLKANRIDLLQDDPSVVSGLFFGSNGVADWLGLVHSSRTSFTAEASTRVVYAGPAPALISSDHGELRYDQTDANNPVYRVNSSNLQSVTGFIAGKTIDMTYMSVKASSTTAAFASVTLQPVDQQTVADSGRLLLSVLTRYENTGMLWNAARTSVGLAWGTTPSLIEPLAATYTFRLRQGSFFSIYALDAQGNRVKQVGGGAGQFTATLDTGIDTTVWYELVTTPLRARPIHPATPQR